MVTAALDRFGRLDFLDNNVGIGSRGSVVDETPENWRRVMQVNVEPMFLAAKYAIPAMIKTAKVIQLLEESRRDNPLIRNRVDLQGYYDECWHGSTWLSRKRYVRLQLLVAWDARICFT
jgi:NAD(P)-dependent dehydrogenase (short-subunit alcohol dehydrogenase family)